MLIFINIKIHDPSLSLYIYRKRRFYNIEGQLRGLPGSTGQKTCASRNSPVSTQVHLRKCTFILQICALTQSANQCASPREILFIKSQILAALCVIFLLTPRLSLSVLALHFSRCRRGRLPGCG